jgi:probable phosphoglycerate mutase
MTTTFWLIRHAETDAVGKTVSGRLPDVHLNSNGRRQAELLAQALARVPLASIYTSPLERALETAEPLARARNLNIRTCEAVNELDFAEWAGKPWSELDPLPEWQRFNAVRSLAPAAGGELMLDVQARIVRELECMRRRHPDQHVAIVSHADILKAAIAHVAGIPIDLFQRIEISPASFSTITLAEHGPKILRLNQTVEL